MDVIIEGDLLYRYKKKWVTRYCKLVQTNSFSDSVKLLIYSSDDNRSKRLSPGIRKSCQLMSKHVVYGHLHGIHMNNEAHIMFVVCKNSVECLAFKEFSIMKVWSDMLTKYLNDISQPVTLIHADKNSQLKAKLDGRLLINCSHISFIRDPSCSEPKLLMSWKIADIMEYGCSKEIKKNVSKGKVKTSFIDLSQNIFIIKASPLCYQAPNCHIFSCHSPKQFCDRLESISANQENFHSPNEFDLVMQQRSRTESFNTIRSNYKSNIGYNSDMEISPESPCTNAGTNLFFSENNQSSYRVPRFQRSVSEAPQRRSRIDSSFSISEDKEYQLTEHNVSVMFQSADKNALSDTDSPLRSNTFTWLERYPYEREPSRTPYRRNVSESNQGSYRTLNNYQWNIEQRSFRPKSSSSYCSLINLRPKSKQFLDPLEISNELNNLTPTQPESFPLHIDKSQGLISRRSAKVSNSCVESVTDNSASPGYVNLEFNQIFEQINQLCTPRVDAPAMC